MTLDPKTVEVADPRAQVGGDEPELDFDGAARPRHPYLKGPWRRSREADLADVLVQHSDADD